MLQKHAHAKSYCERVIVPEEVADLKRIAWWWVEKSYDIGYMKKDDRESR